MKNGRDIDKTTDSLLTHASDALGYMTWIAYPPTLPQAAGDIEGDRHVLRRDPHSYTISRMAGPTGPRP